MKTITFRPLRRIKKTGKITVAAYMQWRKVKTADYSEFNLIVNGEYKSMPLGEYVYDHKGKQLFWHNYTNPELLSSPDLVCLERLKQMDLALNVDRSDLEGEEWKLSCSPVRGGVHYTWHGFDCDGVPVFSHYTADYIASQAQSDEYLLSFEPLTVDMVIKWFGWFLYKLENGYDFKP